MKKIILYTIISFFSIALCYETINYCYQKMNSSSYCEHNDLDCEESRNESEKSNEKIEKADIFDDIILHHDHVFLITNVKQHIFLSHILHSTSDYSKVVYSPPELFRF